MLHPAAGVLRGSALTGGLPPARVTGYDRSDGRDDLVVQKAGVAVETTHRAGGQAGCPDVHDEATRRQPGVVTAGRMAAGFRGVCVLGPGEVCEDGRQRVSRSSPRTATSGAPAVLSLLLQPMCSTSRAQASGEQHAQQLDVEGGRAVLDEVVDGAELLVAGRLVVGVLALRAVRNSRSAASSDSASTKVVRSTVAKAGSWVRGDLRPPQGGCVRNHLGNLQDVGHRVVETEATPQGKLPPLARLSSGGVSERPKDHVSNTCEGETPPWVQIPPPPLRASDEGLLEARRKSAAPMPAASGLRLVGCGAACWGFFGGYAG